MALQTKFDTVKLINVEKFLVIKTSLKKYNGEWLKDKNYRIPRGPRFCAGAARCVHESECGINWLKKSWRLLRLMLNLLSGNRIIKLWRVGGIIIKKI